MLRIVDWQPKASNILYASEMAIMPLRPTDFSSKCLCHHQRLTIGFRNVLTLLDEGVNLATSSRISAAQAWHSGIKKGKTVGLGNELFFLLRYSFILPWKDWEKKVRT